MRKPILVFTIILFSHFSFSQEQHGKEGTEENPFKIFTVDDLNAIREQEDNPLYSALGPLVIMYHTLIFILS